MENEGRQRLFAAVNLELDSVQAADVGGEQMQEKHDQTAFEQTPKKVSLGLDRLPFIWSSRNPVLLTAH